jgi:benzoyl-CoA reductase/2-hydroxyglutaryl-CoA dehydratase subunit BcrC/BadD/HgdB
VEALQIIGASMFMHKIDHNRLLRQLLEETDSLPFREGARLYVTGSSLDSTWFYEIVEACGATVVGEDSDLGNRYFEGLVDETIPPLDAIVDRYHLRPGGSSRSSIQERVDYLVSRATEARADGVICFVVEDDDAAAWDYPEQKKALEALGIPSMFIDRQPYLAKEPDQLKLGIESFLGSMASQRSTTAPMESRV